MPPVPPARTDKKTIKSAYRQLARKFHPDVNKESDAEQRFKDISAAYEVRPGKSLFVGRSERVVVHRVCQKNDRTLMASKQQRVTHLVRSFAQVLADDEKRTMYDRFGEAGLKGGFGPGAGAGGMGGMGSDFRWGCCQDDAVADAVAA